MRSRKKLYIIIVILIIAVVGVKYFETGRSIEIVHGSTNMVIADGWTELESGVYYRLVDAVTADTSFAVIKGNEITVSSDLTKENIPSAQPKLTFTAYAVQKDGFDTAAAAWAEASK